MKLIVCIDENNGMMFNNRRQSKDRVVIEKIEEIIGSEPLYIDTYSKKLFESAIVSDDITNETGFCFIENPELIPCENIEEIHIFCWNKLYPSDCCFEINLTDYRETMTEDFTGYSHENITYKKYILEEEK